MKRVNRRKFKTVMLAVAAMLFVGNMHAQVTGPAQIGQQAFGILKNMSNTSRQQYYNKFSAAISVLGSANAPVEFYNQMYDLILSSGFDFGKIKFVEFNECPSDMMHRENNISDCSASTLVFEYQGNKYYIKVAYFLYNSKYYLFGFRDRGIKNYPF